MICDDCTWGDCESCPFSQAIESIENLNVKTQNLNDDLIFRADAIKKVEHIMLRDKLYLRFNYKERRTALVDAIMMIKKCPPANRPTGEWIDKGEYAECPICGAHSEAQFDGVELIPLKTNFCSNCGARLIGGDSK